MLVFFCIVPNSFPLRFPELKLRETGQQLPQHLPPPAILKTPFPLGTAAATVEAVDADATAADVDATNATGVTVVATLDKALSDEVKTTAAAVDTPELVV